MQYTITSPSGPLGAVARVFLAVHAIFARSREHFDNQQWAAYARLGLLALGLLACLQVGAEGFGALLSGPTRSWTEQVQLHDGSVITARRTYVLGGRSEPGARESASTYQTVVFSTPLGDIEWNSDFRDAQPELNSLSLIAFDIVNGTPFIATRPAGCIAFNKWQRPNPPQVLFKYVNQQWIRIGLDDFPKEITEANVVLGRPTTEVLKPFYSVDAVQKENFDVRQPEYRSILRVPLKSGGSSCEETFANGKGRALGANWFKLSRDMAACKRTCQIYEYDASACPCKQYFKAD